MLSKLRIRLAVLGALLALPCMSAAAQCSVPVCTLRDLVRPAAMIFSGTVTTIEFVSSTPQRNAGVVQVGFRVNEGFRGARTGEVVQISEWAGLWSSGQRYRVGDRVLLLLHAPSKFGLTSPVGGELGRFALDRRGNVVLDNRRERLLGRRAPRAQVSVPYRSFAGRLRYEMNK
jgi:hypothetical protein